MEDRMMGRPLASAALFFVVGYALGCGRWKDVGNSGLRIAGSLGSVAYGRLSERLKSALSEIKASEGLGASSSSSKDSAA